MSEPTNTQFSSSLRLLPEPRVDGLLDDVPNGEPNLLPEAATHDDLKVWFELWEHSDPTLGEESVELFFDDVSVDTRYWSDAPIEASDRFVTLPKRLLRGNDGQHRLRYKVTAYNDETDDSRELVITLDTTAPVLANDSKLIFPSAVTPPNQITAAYLADPAHEDQVLATVPDYIEKKVGDEITWYWERSPGGREIADTKTLQLDDLGKVLQVSFKGDLLRRSTNNVDYFATYRVCDRAGNETVLSSDVLLNVNIRPPTPRKYPTVKEASSTGGTGVLNPFQGGAGVTVVVAASEVDPGEEVTVDFVGLGGEDGIGSVTGVEPITPGGLEFAIPASVVAANIPVNGDGRKVDVYYWAGQDVQHSAVYTLTINAFATGALGQVGCRQAQVGSPATLSKDAVPPGGANLEIEKWIYQAPTQLMNVWAMASNVRTDFVVGVPLGTDGKYTTLLPKDYVDQRPLNSTFTLYASVSFDQGHSYISFKTLPLKIIA